MSDTKNVKERVELRCHTQYSIRRGLQSVKEVLDFAEGQNMSAVAFTDYNNVYAYPDIVNRARGRSIKPIYGIEAAVVNDLFELDTNTIKYGGCFYVSVLIKNETGRKNLYRLLSESNTKHGTRILLSHLLNNKEGLLLGSGSPEGLLGQAVRRGEGEETLIEIAGYYDYLEIQPLGANYWIMSDENKGIKTVEDIKAFNEKIISLGEKSGVIVVATSNAYYLRPENKISYEIIMNACGNEKYIDSLLHIRTTSEMLDDFSYLGRDKAYEYVVENTNKIADAIEMIRPIPKGKYICNKRDDFERLNKICEDEVAKKYGHKDNLPDIERERLKEELRIIRSTDTAYFYLYYYDIIQINNLNPTQYGLRGGASSMYICFLLGISHVNPLDKDFPLYKEFFVGINGDKMPGLDIIVDEEVWPDVIQSVKDIPGIKAYRALYFDNIDCSDKSIDEYVKKYENSHELSKQQRAQAENDLKGVIISRELHPGGIVIVPDWKDICEITPLESLWGTEWKATQFEYHSMDMIFDIINIYPNENCTLNSRLYTITKDYPSLEVLKSKELIEFLTSSDHAEIKNAVNAGETDALPSMSLLSDEAMHSIIKSLKPESFEDIVRVYCLYHGTGTWFENGEELFSKGIPINKLISSREDVYEIMLSYGILKEKAYKIAEDVRKGKMAGSRINEDLLNEMTSHGVPESYIESLKIIKFLFPRAYAAERVYMELCTLYYKMKYPELYSKTMNDL